MISDSNIFEEIRSCALLFHSLEAKVVWSRNPISFGAWLVDRDQGPSQVFSKDKEISFRCSNNEISAILLAEAELLTNQCLEHANEMLLYLGQKNRVRSEAWLVVTIYYYAFFAAQALLRLLGKPTVFLDKPKAAYLRSLSSDGTPIGAGTYSLSGPFETTSSGSDYKLIPNKHRPHQAVWCTLLGFIQAQIQKHRSTASSKTFMFYNNLSGGVLRNIYQDMDWPSGIRHVANYSPGFAYQLVFQKLNLDALHTLERARSATAPKLLENLQSSIVCVSKSSLYKHHVCLLHDFSHCVFYLMRTVYAELFTRRKFDRRWEQDRERFTDNNLKSPKNYPFIASSLYGNSAD